MGRRLVGAGLLAATALIVGGCGWLFGFSDPYPSGVYPSGDPSYPEGSFGPSATFKTGHATLRIGDDPVIELAELTEGGTIAEDFGAANASFRNAAGWYVRIFGASKADPSMAFVSIDRIVDVQHWSTGDPSGCTVSITKADETGLVGKATCKGLRWSDAMSAGFGPEPPYIKGQAPFDAVITFEAAAAGSAMQAG
jgi:hypothetical protein